MFDRIEASTTIIMTVLSYWYCFLSSNLVIKILFLRWINKYIKVGMHVTHLWQEWAMILGLIDELQQLEQQANMHSSGSSYLPAT
jgi:hypothetical protein